MSPPSPSRSPQPPASPPALRQPPPAAGPRRAQPRCGAAALPAPAGRRALGEVGWLLPPYCRRVPPASGCAGSGSGGWCRREPATPPGRGCRRGSRRGGLAPGLAAGSSVCNVFSRLPAPPPPGQVALLFLLCTFIRVGGSELCLSTRGRPGVPASALRFLGCRSPPPAKCVSFEIHASCFWGESKTSPLPEERGFILT